MTPEQLRKLQVLKLGFIGMTAINLAVTIGGQMVLKRNHELELENIELAQASMYIIHMMNEKGVEPDEFDLIAINTIRNSKRLKKNQ